VVGVVPLLVVLGLSPPPPPQAARKADKPAGQIHEGAVAGIITLFGLDAVFGGAASMSLCATGADVCVDVAGVAGCVILFSMLLLEAPSSAHLA
jgi:hypothetical protein